MAENNPGVIVEPGSGDFCHVVLVGDGVLSFLDMS